MMYHLESTQMKVETMCAQAGVGGHMTNHSLRATAATELCIPEKLNQECTGHCSLEALRTYKHSSEEQHKTASALLSAPNYTHHQHYTSEKSRTFSLSSPLQGHGNSGISMPVTLHNLHGCTINTTPAPLPVPQLHVQVDLIKRLKYMSSLRSTLGTL